MAVADKQDNPFCAITSYFNPMGYKTRWQNYQSFREGLQARGIPLLTVECVSQGAGSVLQDDDSDVLVVEAGDVLWQKERLLNVALASLPRNCKYVGWIDCDVLFESDSWCEDACELLENHAVVQLFADAIMLDENAVEPKGSEETFVSYGAKIAEDPSVATLDFQSHGHTGFAWAIRRDVIAPDGFFDLCVVGGADHVMAHVFAGDWNVPCVDRLLGADTLLRRQFDTWASAISPRLFGGVGYVPGNLRHLWHGSLGDRRYLVRNQDLLKLDFDPSAELQLSPSGCWIWKDPHSPAAQFIKNYMRSRREDGDGK